VNVAVGIELFSASSGDGKAMPDVGSTQTTSEVGGSSLTPFQSLDHLVQFFQRLCISSLTGF
jgi:hypothetical protein